MSRSIVSINFAAALLLCACGGQSTRHVGGRPMETVPFEDVTLQNIIRWPSHIEYIEATAVGRPPEAEKDVELRRKASREQASFKAQEQLIIQLKKMVPREQIQMHLRKAKVGHIEYGYDDTCTLTLQIPKEEVVGKPPIE